MHFLKLKSFRILLFYVFLFIFSSSIFVAKATPSLQQTIWFNPQTFECTSRPTFDEHGLILLSEPWTQGNKLKSIICTLADVNTLINLQGVLIVTLALTFLALLTNIVFNVVQKKPILSIKRAIILVIVFSSSLFFLSEYINNLRIWGENQTIYLLFGLTIPTVYYLMKHQKRRK